MINYISTIVTNICMNSDIFSVINLVWPLLALLDMYLFYFSLIIKHTENTCDLKMNKPVYIYLLLYRFFIKRLLCACFL